MCLYNLIVYIMKLDYSPISCICVWRLRWRTDARNMWEVVPRSYLYWCLEDFLLFSIHVVIWLVCMSSALYCNFTLIVLVGDVEDSWPCTMLPICLIDKFNHDICWGVSMCLMDHSLFRKIEHFYLDKWYAFYVVNLCASVLWNLF